MLLWQSDDGKYEAIGTILNWASLDPVLKGYGMQVARLLLEQHADVNARDHMGSTPLHRAASLGHDHVVRLFLEGYRNKLDLDARDAVGNTPL